MSFKAPTLLIRRASAVFVLLFTIYGCATSNEQNKSTEARQKKETVTSPYYRNLQNGFSVRSQQAPPPSIQSVHLYQSSNKHSAPFIELDSEQTLTLEFDYMGTDARQFRVQVSHRNTQWEKSILARSFFQKGLFEDVIASSYMSSAQHPTYQHYRYTFPNQSFQLKESGNYMVAVYDYGSEEKLFSLPFFVYEKKGQLRTSIQSIPAPIESTRRYHQLFGVYFYPDFVAMPQFDLSYYFVQNEFWGRYKQADIVQSIQGRVNFHVSREKAFIADYGFKYLDLRTLGAGGVNIRDYQPAREPPHVILQRDIQDLTPSVDATRTPRFGLPFDQRDAKYVEVFFFLETAVEIRPNERIYVTGDFNNWTIQKSNRMTYDPQEEAWTGSALIKQGQYTYKYVVVSNGVVKDMLLDNSFSLSRQKYYALVYFEDPDMNFKRLLQIQSFQSN